MEGQCWSLAIAHHRRYGWPIFVLGGYEDENERDNWETITFYHVMVRHPTGPALDIKGPQDVGALLDEWGDAEFLPLSEDQLIKLFRNPEMAPKPAEIDYAGKVIDYYLKKKYPALYQG